MRPRGVTGKLPAAKLTELKHRVALNVSDWAMLGKMVRSWGYINKKYQWYVSMSNMEFLVGQGYIGHPLGVANFVCDHCPVQIRAVWKEFNLDHDHLLNLLGKHGEKKTAEAVMQGYNDKLEQARKTSGICLAALEVAVEGVEAGAVTPSSIADKYIPKFRKSRFYK